MKKILSILLIIAFVSGSAFPIGYYSTDNRRTVRLAVVTNLNTAGTASTLKTHLTSDALGILTDGQRILGYTIAPIGTTGGDTVLNTESVFAIYDRAASSGLEFASGDYTTLEVEAESLSNEPVTVFFPYPYEIKDGILVYLGPNAVLTIYYESAVY